MPDKIIKAVIAGQPNSGKSSMFNALTGAAVRVGNYPGITVEREERVIESGEYEIILTDLPGSYSLTSYSPEERVMEDVILNERPDICVYVIDASALERGLALAAQLMELGVPIIAALNMMDEVADKGIKINTRKLSEKLGFPVLECVARREIGTDQIPGEIVKLYEKTKGKWTEREIFYGRDLEEALDSMEKKLAPACAGKSYSPRWAAVKLLEGDARIRETLMSGHPEILGALEGPLKKTAAHIEKTLEDSPEAVISDYRRGFVSAILKDGIISVPDNLRFDITDMADKFLTHKLMGPLIMFLALYAMYALIFKLGEYPENWIAAFFGLIEKCVASAMPEGLLRDLIIEGAIKGPGAVLGFSPYILIMFAMIVFLEDLGYMARAAYMLDRVFRAFGLHGASVMPFIISGGIPGGCAVPGVMASRTLRSPRERLATILTAPFMVCGAKTTVFLMLTEAFFPKNASTAMFLLTVTAWVFGLCTAWILRKTVISGPPTPFVMELPPYRLPTLRGVAIHTWERLWQFIKKAGTVILLVSALMWLLMTFPRLPEERAGLFDQKEAAVKENLETLKKTDAPDKAEKEKTLSAALSHLRAERDNEALKCSVAGRLGSAMESVTQHCGFHWRMNIALIGGFAAKEIIIATLSTAYAIEAPDSGGQTGENPKETALKERISKDPSWTLPAKISLLLFVLLYAPCAVTIAAMARESSWKWALLCLFGTTAMAYVAAVIVYQAGNALLR
jgi:ferrous iron transport protein B